MLFLWYFDKDYLQLANIFKLNRLEVRHDEQVAGRTSCGSVGLKLGRGGNASGPFWRRLGLSVQCGFKDGLGGVQLFSDQKCELLVKGLVVSGEPIGFVDDNGLCFVTNTGSVVTCQWEVCGKDPAALEWKKSLKLALEHRRFARLF